jgi:hypothetical protein
MRNEGTPRRSPVAEVFWDNKRLTDKRTLDYKGNFQWKACPNHSDSTALSSSLRGIFSVRCGHGCGMDGWISTAIRLQSAETLRHALNNVGGAHDRVL